MMWKLVLFVALLCCGSEGSGISCKNENNGDVDWYILYKLPDKTLLGAGAGAGAGAGTGAGTGFSYYYIDPTEDRMNRKPINDKNGVLANTLAPYFDKTSGVGFIAYNDGKTPNQNLGHSKGFVMMDNTSGIWLLHSTPNFPNDNKKDDFFPDSGKTFGQTFICVTFPYNQFKDIGEHLQSIRAPTFKHHIPSDFHPSLQQAANKQRLNSQKVSFDLESKNKVEFKSFVSKISEHVKVGDLYVTIADNIESDVDVQTWGRQVNRNGNYEPVSGYKVLNVECISIDSRLWGPSHDHSKWCVSKSKHWTCIADSNRAKTQFKRPGGALCIKDKRVTDFFKGFIKDESNCSNGPTPNKQSKHS